jgi:uncharacterized protein YjiS (DUF1127 family)
MNTTSTLQILPRDTAPEVSPGRIARTIAGPRRLMLPMTGSANQASIHEGVGAPVRPTSAADLLQLDAGSAPAADRHADATELHHAARRFRMRRLGDLVAAAGRAIAMWLRHAVAAYRRHGEERATYLALAALDSHTLRDLGVDRGELRAVAYRLAHGESLDQRRGLR